MVTYRQGMLLALLRCSDLPLAALLSGRSVLSALPVALGLGAASILAGLGAEGRAADEVLLAATTAAAACRAVRCGLGKRLLRSAGVENSVQGLFFATQSWTAVGCYKYAINCYNIG